jgi:hypothetical protein
MRHSRRQIGKLRRSLREDEILSPTPERLLMSCVVVGDDKTFWHLLDSPQSRNS